MTRAIVNTSSVLASITVEVAFTDALFCDTHTSEIAVLFTTWSVTDITSPQPLTFTDAILTCAVTTAVSFTPLAWVEHGRKLFFLNCGFACVE
jgi:hypothetical protein